MDYPDSPEGVAFALLLTIVGNGAGCPQTNQTPASYLLDLFCECLRAVHGEREGRSEH